MVIVGFSTPKAWNPLSWVIKLFTRSPVSHVWFLVDDPVFGCRMVQEEHLFGLRLIPFTVFVKKNVVVGLATPKQDISPALQQSAEWMGSAYDHLGLVGMAWVLVGRLFEKKWANPLASSKAMFCSEQVVRALQLVEYPGTADLHADTVAPYDLYLAMKNDPYWDFVPGTELDL